MVLSGWIASHSAERAAQAQVVVLCREEEVGEAVDGIHTSFTIVAWWKLK